MTKSAGSCGRRENKYYPAKVSQHCNDFADDVGEFSALHKRLTVSVDLHALSSPLPRFSQPANRNRGSPAGQGSNITMAETFIPTLEYRHAVAAFATAMGLEPDDIKITLGEDFNVWPESIRCDADQRR
jgi:hypothetical protein